MIDLENIHMIFNAGTNVENYSLKGVSCRIPRGEFVTVIGSNGAGKSTLLNVIAGEYKPTAGTVLIDGVDVTNQPSYLRAARVARVFQDPLAGTCESLTVEENLAFASKRGMRRGLKSATSVASKKVFRELLAQLELGLEDRLQDKIGLLSGGQRQAVSLLMATLCDVSVLLLDEHTAALDPKTADYVLRITENVVQKTRPAVVMITHSMKQALEHGQRMLMLHNGQIVLDIDEARKSRLTAPELLSMFSQAARHNVTDDMVELAA